MDYDQLISKFVHAELELAKERNDTLEQLREDPKRDILLNLLENNVNSTRRIHFLKEATLGRIARNVLDQEYESDEDCDCCCCECEDGECEDDKCEDGECENTCDDEECDDDDEECDDDDEESGDDHDEKDDLSIKVKLSGKPYTDCPTQFGDFANTIECFTKCALVGFCREFMEVRSEQKNSKEIG